MRPSPESCCKNLTGLPIDTTPGGLRKFDKKTMFMVSDILCGQIDRMKGMTLGDLVLSVLPWPFHKELSVPERGPCNNGPGLSLGLMCSLSIPIITICALLLLMIMVNLLDFIFRWLPYFVICLPIPGFKGKHFGFDNVPKWFSHIHGYWPVQHKGVDLTYRGFPTEITFNWQRYDYFGKGGWYGFGDQGGWNRGMLAEGNFAGGRMSSAMSRPAQCAATGCNERYGVGSDAPSIVQYGVSTVGKAVDEGM